MLAAAREPGRCWRRRIRNRSSSASTTMTSPSKLPVNRGKRRRISVSFEVSQGKEYPGKDYDFVAVFDCLHDMGDPIGAAAHVRQSLTNDGIWMIVEPFANDQLKDNLNPVGRVYYSFSTLLCTPRSRSQEVGLCLGAQAGESRLAMSSPKLDSRVSVALRKLRSTRP